MSHRFPYEILTMYLRIRQFWTELPNDKPRANQLKQTGHPIVHRTQNGRCVVVGRKGKTGTEIH
jgi:hypothetical protein